jgi:hypothetical protein
MYAFFQEARPWVCSDCGLMFDTRKFFKKHIKRGHTESVIQVQHEGLFTILHQLTILLQELTPGGEDLAEASGQVPLNP